jgi:hypothetical protein
MVEAELGTASGGFARSGSTAGVKSLPARSSVSYWYSTFGAFFFRASATAFACPMP